MTSTVNLFRFFHTLCAVMPDLMRHLPVLFQTFMLVHVFSFFPEKLAPNVHGKPDRPRVLPAPRAGSTLLCSSSFTYPQPNGTGSYKRHFPKSA